MDTRPFPNELYHYGVKGMKWGIRRTPEQLGRRASPKHRDIVSRNQYTKARVEGAKKRLTKKYNKRLSKEEERYKNSDKSRMAKDRIKVARETHRNSMQNLDRNAKVNVTVRDVASWSIKSAAKSNLIPLGTAVAAAALTSATGGASAPALIAALNGGAFIGGAGAIASNTYRGYQTARNIIGYYNVPDKKK